MSTVNVACANILLSWTNNALNHANIVGPTCSNLAILLYEGKYCYKTLIKFSPNGTSNVQAARTSNLRIVTVVSTTNVLVELSLDRTFTQPGCRWFLQEFMAILAGKSAFLYRVLLVRKTSIYVDMRLWFV